MQARARLPKRNQQMTVSPVQHGGNGRRDDVLPV